MALPVPVPAIRLDATAWLHGFGGLRRRCREAVGTACLRIGIGFAIIACALIGVICGGAQAKRIGSMRRSMPASTGKPT